MAKKDKDGNWLDEKGRAIPESYIKPEDKKRDTLVERIIKKVVKLSDRIAEDKVEIVGSIEKYLEDLSKDNKVKESWKGNILIYNFTKDLVIERRIDESIGFDEKLQMVKTIIDKWLSDKMQGANEELAKVISQAFSIDKKGRINTQMLLKLLRLDINDADWKKAMKMLKESIMVTSSKQSIMFRRKVNTEAGEAWESICLNFNDTFPAKEK